MINTSEHEAIQELNDTIAELIGKFEKQTGRTVESIDVRHEEGGAVYASVNSRPSEASKKGSEG